MCLYVTCPFFVSVPVEESVFQLYSAKLLWFLLIYTIMDGLGALLWEVLYKGKTKRVVKSLPQIFTVVIELLGF